VNPEEAVKRIKSLNKDDRFQTCLFDSFNANAVPAKDRDLYFAVDQCIGFYNTCKANGDPPRDARVYYTSVVKERRKKSKVVAAADAQHCQWHNSSTFCGCGPLRASCFIISFLDSVRR
jgi:hypothetical protein